MGTEVINVSFDVLQEELDKAKSNLKGLNDNIRRINGREPPEILRGDRKRTLDRRSDRERNSDYGSQYETSRSRVTSRSGIDRDRNDRDRDGSPVAKRKMETKSVFSRLSGPPNSRDDDIKPKLNSRIIRELPTKEEIVEAQGSDPASRARNRRMFGSLLGTLQKFCQEESRLKQKEQKKAQIERKLEEQQNQEREIMKKERQNLYNNRKRQQMEIKMLENKMNLMKEFSTWEETKKPLMNFIRTKTKPRIYYLPKVLDKRTERKLDECKRDIEKQIEKRRAEVNEEMADIVNRFEAATEALQPIDISAQNISLDQSAVDNQMDQSEDDSYYHNSSFKSAVNKPNDKNSKNDASNHDSNERNSCNDAHSKSYSNDEDDELDIKNVSIKIEKTDDHLEKNDENLCSDEDDDDNDDVNNGDQDIEETKFKPGSRSPSHT